MAGETDLKKLLASLTPELHDGTFVFATFPDGQLPGDVSLVMAMQEPEGLTAILPLEEAQRFGLDTVFPAAWITLSVHSDLAAVGMMAAVSAALTDAGISCNPVAGYYHDHLFVQYDRAADAMAAIEALQQRAMGA